MDSEAMKALSKKLEGTLLLKKAVKQLIGWGYGISGSSDRRASKFAH